MNILISLGKRNGYFNISSLKKPCVDQTFTSQLTFLRTFNILDVSCRNVIRRRHKVYILDFKWSFLVKPFLFGMDFCHQFYN